MKSHSLFKQHQMDPSFVKAFPLSTYQIVNSVSQGQFYIEHNSPDLIKIVLASHAVWEQPIVNLIQKYAQPNTVAIDIGAHIGTHTIRMSQCVQQDGIVIAFEPQAKLHRELIMNLQLNSCENVIPIQAALGSQNGFAYLEPLRIDNEGYRSITSKRPTEKITLATLDSFQLKRVSFIKMDAESYELEILRGSHETIMNNRPVIILEIGGGLAREQEENIDPTQLLTSALDMLNNVFHYDVSKIPGTHLDYLALPKKI